MDMSKTWKEYCEENDTDTLYFSNNDRSRLLIVAEGTGDNLMDEDYDEGYVDYWNIEAYGDNNGDGGFMMCKELICDENPTLEKIIKDVDEFEHGLIPEGDYLIDPEEGEELMEAFLEKDMQEMLDR